RIYHRPRTRFVADFIGRSSFIPGTVTTEGRVETCLGVFAGNLPDGAAPGDRVDVMIRPDDILHNDDSPRTARVVDRAFRGAHMLYTLELDGGVRVPCMAPSHHAHPVGGRIGIELEMDHLVTFTPIESGTP
ncbi:MAG: TOBE domain-containing protein, partial [Pseudomonadota bacterium]|nr:TOBE domain-containing protein [Pseudomonadota bacterium]